MKKSLRRRGPFVLENEIKSKDKNLLLQVRGLKKYFPVRRMMFGEKQHIKAIQNLTFDLYEGEVYGLVGESGCGKSTTGRTLLRLIDPTEGEAIFQGRDIFKQNDKSFRNIRKEMQMVFQDPYSSLNPRKRIGKSIEEPMIIHNIGRNQKERTEMVMNLLHRVGFSEDSYYRYPHEFSGGQRQRIGIARALAVNPKLIICDEPVSALDVSIQSQIINLLQELKEQYKLTYIFIAHDLSVVRHISDRIGVMYLGNLVEEANTDDLFRFPKHPYTQALISSIPIPNPTKKRERIRLEGEIPSQLNPPKGCVFHTRCPHAMDICKLEVPVRKQVNSNHSVLCHLY